MQISHKILNISGENVLYIYVTVEDIYEFGKENLDKGENTNFLIKLREYVTKNFKSTLKTSAIIVINGVIIGSLTLASLYANTEDANIPETNIAESIYSEYSSVNTENTNKDKNIIEIATEDKKENNEEIITPAKNNKESFTTTDKTTKTESVKAPTKTTAKATSSSNKTASSKTNTNTKKTSSTKTSSSKKKTTSTKTQNKTTSSTTNTTINKKPNKITTTTSTTTLNSKPVQNTSNSTTNKANSTTTTNTSNASKPATSTNTPTTSPSGYTIKLNNGGTIVSLDLEEYIIGVVAAEMPASFHSEALKAQAVVARTYAMKKASKGITLQNSTYHQVYNTTSQMKAKWGSSYSTYYNKVKNAVNATKGMVLKYNDTYIEALYFSMSNGKTELPSYVWTTDYPYLKVVSSSWDQNISGSKHTMNFTYEKLSEKLGVTVDENSDVIVLSKTPGDRINEISIAGKTFKGTKIKALLGLRSTDFNIVKTPTGFTITTIGFGHGVGMSQYGANGAAKSGMTYKQILNHYYSGASLVKI